MSDHMESTYAEDVAQLREYHENHTPRWWQDWRYPAALAALFATLAILIFGTITVLERREDSADISTFTRETECVRKINANTEVARIDVEIARGALIITQAEAALASFNKQPVDVFVGRYQAEIDDLRRTEIELEVRKQEQLKLTEICKDK